MYKQSLWILIFKYTMQFKLKMRLIFGVGSLHYKACVPVCTMSRTDDCIEPKPFSTMHWYIPASSVFSSTIFTLFPERKCRRPSWTMAALWYQVIFGKGFPWKSQVKIAVDPTGRVSSCNPLTIVAGSTKRIKVYIQVYCFCKVSWKQQGIQNV